MPFSFRPLFRVPHAEYPVFVLVLVVFFLAGCLKQYEAASIQPRSDPALEAHSRLLKEAETAYANGRYPVAVRLLTRFINAYPASPRLSEARWRLALSYEQIDDVPAALALYRDLAGEASSSTLPDSYQLKALGRLRSDGLRSCDDWVGRYSVTVPGRSRCWFNGASFPLCPISNHGYSA